MKKLYYRKRPYVIAQEYDNTMADGWVKQVYNSSGKFNEVVTCAADSVDGYVPFVNTITGRELISRPSYLLYDNDGAVIEVIEKHTFELKYKEVKEHESFEDVRKNSR